MQLKYINYIFPSNIMCVCVGLQRTYFEIAKRYIKLFFIILNLEQVLFFYYTLLCTNSHIEFPKQLRY